MYNRWLSHYSYIHLHFTLHAVTVTTHTSYYTQYAIIIITVGRPDQGADDSGRGRSTHSGRCTQTSLGVYIWCIVYIMSTSMKCSILVGCA